MSNNIGIKSRLITKLTITFMILVIGIFGATGFLYYYITKKKLDEKMGERLIEIAKAASFQVDVDRLKFLSPGDEDSRLYKRIRKNFAKFKDTADIENIYVFDERYIVLFDLSDKSAVGEKKNLLLASRKEISRAFKGNACYTPLYRGADGRLYKSAFAPVIDENNRISVVIGIDGNPRFLKLIDNVLGWIFTAGAICLTSIILLSILFISTITKRLKKLDRITQQISSLNFDVWAESGNRDEIDLLGKSFNEMITALINMRKFFEYILESMANGILTIDLDGKITSLNPSAVSILNLAEEGNKGKDFTEVLARHKKIISHFEDCLLKKNGSPYLEIETENESGEKISLGGSFFSLKNDREEIIGIAFSFADITKVKKLEERIKINQRLAALGQISTGVAHEIRNPLASIQMYIDLLQRKIEEGSNEASLLEKISLEINNLNKFLTEFLNFAKPPKIIPSPHNLHDILESALTQGLLSKENPDVEVEREYQKEVSKVYVDGVQLKRAFLNLFLNSLQAMDNGGKLTIATKFSDSKAEITITDTGCGIPKEDLSQIFNPFFTTKENGIGLGLPIAHKIIKEHDGEMEIRSRQGVGTEIAIWLPTGNL